MGPFLDSIPTSSLGIEDHTLTSPVAQALTTLDNRAVRDAAAHASTAHRPSFHGTGAVAFSTKGEYGVRLMVQLGRRFGTGPASLTGMAADQEPPRAYL